MDSEFYETAIFSTYNACPHSSRTDVDSEIQKCTDCGEELCKHSEIDMHSNCVICGEYIQEISNDRAWNTNAYTYGNQSVKSTDHTKSLKTLGIDEEVILLTMQKYMEVDNRMKNEIPVIAACTFLSYMDVKRPRTIHEICKMFNKLSGGEKMTRSRLQKSLKSVYEVFPQYITKYITISSMIPSLMEKIGIEDVYYEYIYQIAKHVEKTWSTYEHSKRSTPQNIASIIIYKYIFSSPTLSEIYNESDIIKKLGISKITLTNIENTLNVLVEFP